MVEAREAAMAAAVRVVAQGSAATAEVAMAEVLAAAKGAAATAVGAQGEVRGLVTWERAVVVAKGQGRMERAAAAKEAVTAAAAKAEVVLAEVTEAGAKGAETETRLRQDAGRAARGVPRRRGMSGWAAWRAL